MSVIVTGDDVSLPVTLKKNNAVFLINPAAIIKASIISEDRSTILISPVTCLSTAAGAAWSSSLIIVNFNSAETGSVINYGPALLEIQVDDGGKTTWFVTVNIEKGTIS